MSFTGTGANGTVGHGLGAVPKMIIQKKVDLYLLHGLFTRWNDSFTGAQVIYLNETGAVGSNTSSWNSTVPTALFFLLVQVLIQMVMVILKYIMFRRKKWIFKIWKVYREWFSWKPTIYLYWF